MTRFTICVLTINGNRGVKEVLQIKVGIQSFAFFVLHTAVKGDGVASRDSNLYVRCVECGCFLLDEYFCQSRVLLAAVNAGAQLDLLLFIGVDKLSCNNTAH